MDKHTPGPICRSMPEPGTGCVEDMPLYPPKKILTPRRTSRFASGRNWTRHVMRSERLTLCGLEPAFHIPDDGKRIGRVDCSRCFHKRAARGESET